MVHYRGIIVRIFLCLMAIELILLPIGIVGLGNEDHIPGIKYVREFTTGADFNIFDTGKPDR